MLRLTRFALARTSTPLPYTSHASVCTWRHVRWEHNSFKSTAARSASTKARPWHPVIGLEVHAQLDTTRKLFSDTVVQATARYGHAPVDGALAFLPPNTQVSVVDAALPGTLPHLNRDCITHAVRVGLALGCHIATRSTFDRKHYAYHDLPAGYQITQKFEPIASGGMVEVPMTMSAVTNDALKSGDDHDAAKNGNDGDANGMRRVTIQQVQLEQDTAKTGTASGHRIGNQTNDAVTSHDINNNDMHSVDLNRAGMPLLEIVTDPDFRSGAEAAAFVRKVQGILRALHASQANMDEGSLRVDVNVSMRRTVLGADGLEQEENGARVELKNLSSLRTIQHAIEYEIQRQTHHLLTATTPLPAETRGYDPLTSTTIHLRPKETTLDYRYMPDPDLPPIVVDPAEVEALRKAMPELPDARRRRLERVYGVSAYQAERLVETPGAAALFERAVWTPTLKSGTGEIVTSSSSTATSQHPRDAVHVANTLLNTVFGEMTALGMLTLTRDGADVSMSNATVTARTSEDHHLLTDGDEDSNLILSPRQLASVVDAVDAGRIAYHQGKTILGKMLQANVANDRTTNNVERDALVDRFLEGVTFVDGETLRAAVRDLARANPLQVAQLGGIIPLTSTGTPLQPPPSPPPPRKVKPTVLTWFSGQLMRTVRGRADPAQMHAALEQVLGKEFSVAPSVFQSWHAASDGGGSGKRKDKKNKKKGGE